VWIVWGRSGGLLLLWKSDFNVMIQNYSYRHINVVIASCENNPELKFTEFYGYPNTAKRKESWDLLWHLNTLHLISWLCIRDFNEIINLLEKRALLSALGGKWKTFNRAWRILNYMILDLRAQITRGIMVIKDENILWRSSRARIYCEKIGSGCS
jgi:hypothetical protein